MHVLDIKKPIRLRSEKAIQRALANDNLHMMTMPYMINYQCLIYFDRIVFSLQSKKGEISDKYKVNNKVRDIRLEIARLQLPEQTLLIGGFFHKNPDCMASFIKGLTGTALNYQKEVEYVVYDIGFYNGKSLLETTFDERRMILNQFFQKESKQVRLLEIYTDKEKDSIFQENKGVFNFYKKDGVFYDNFYRYNNFETYHVVIMEPNMNRRVLKSFTIGQFKGGQLMPVGSITNLTKEIVSCADPKEYCGKIALVQSRCAGKKLLNPKLVQILNDEKDLKKCKFGDDNFFHHSKYYF